MHERCFFLFWKVFFLLEGGFLVWWCFSLFGKVFPCLERFFLVWKAFPCLERFFLAGGVPSRNPNFSLKSPRKPKTFRYFVPRGTLIQSRISKSLLLIALYTCLIQCINNKTNKTTMIKGRASHSSYNIPPQLKRHIPTKQGD